MKINEFTDPLRTYIVTVRVVLKNTSTTVRTSIKAEGPSQAFMMLSRLYGMGNVVCITEIVNESARTCQIQLVQEIRPKRIRGQQPHATSDSVQASLVDDAGLQPRRPKLSARPIASPLKHELIRRRLTRQLMRQSNIVSPTADDVRVARNLSLIHI